MFYENRFPHVKAFEDEVGSVCYILYEEKDKVSSYMETCPGVELVNFCELDLSDYKERLNMFTKMEYSPANYGELCVEAVFNIAGLLQNKHLLAYVFTSFTVADDFYRSNTPEVKADPVLLEKVQRQDILNAQKHLEDILIIQDIFKDAIKICLDKDNMSEKHISERLLEFLSKYPAFNLLALNCGYALHAIDKKKKGKNQKEGKIDPIDVMKENGKNLSVMNYTIIESVIELFYFEFMQMMKNGKQVKRCECCGKYFVLKDNRKRKYCDRIFKEGKRCNEIGHINTYKESLGDENDPLRIAKGFYNTMYSRMSRALDKLPRQESEKDISEEEFKEWSKKHSKAKRDYKNGIISGDEMLSIIREGYV